MASDLRALNRNIKRRLIHALSLGLPTQLAQDLADEGLDGVGVIPTPEDFWDMTAPKIGEILAVRPIGVAISNTQATQYVSRQSGDNITASVIINARIAVVLVFSPPAGYPVLEREGRQLAQAEVLELLADIYRGAVLEVILRDAVDGESILEIFPNSDFADTITPDTTTGALGRAVLEFNITAQGLHPVPSYSLER